MVDTSSQHASMLKTVLLAGCTGFFALSAQAQQSDAEARYADILQQISNLSTSIAHKEAQIETQKSNIASLREQINGVTATMDSIEPMLSKMAASISDEIASDIPFNAEERFNRLGALEDAIANQEVGIGDKWRRALDIYNAEVNYGNTMQAHDGDHPTNPGMRLQACEESLTNKACAISEVSKELSDMIGEKTSLNELDADEVVALRKALKDGTYLRYGRLSYVYMQADDSEALRYNPTTKEWVKVEGSRALDVRRSIKIAKGEAAPGVVEAPVFVTN